MNRLDRYIARQLMFTTGLAWLLITSMDSLFALLGEINDIGRGSYGLAEMFRYILFSVPQRASELFPVAALLGGLTALGSVSDHGELLAIRLAGFSPLRLARSVLLAGGLMLLLLVPLTEFVAPAAQQQAQKTRALAIFNRVSWLGEQGLWIRDGSRFINVRGVDADGRLAGVRFYQFSGHRLQVAGNAAYAELQTGQWRLLSLEETLFGDGHTRGNKAESIVRPTGVTADLLNVLVSAPESMSLPEQLRYIRYLQDNYLGAERYQLAFWTRFSRPLVTLTMLVLAVVFVLGVLRTAGTGRRVFAGIITGLLFQLLSNLLSQLSLVYGWSPLAGAFMPLFLILSITLIALWYQNKHA